jgi:two-component system chemotaxis sensor kinase CheA
VARDPYKYFRVEARELVEQLGQGILGLSKTPLEPELVPRLLRLAHTLKGAARVVRQPEIAEIAHAFEESLLPLRDASSAASAELVRELLTLIDRASSAVRALDVPEVAEPSPAANVTNVTNVTSAAASAPARPAADETLRTVRVDIEDTDALLRGVSEASVQVAALKRELSHFEQLGSLARVVSDLLAPRSGPGASVAKAREHLEGLRTQLEQFRRGLASGLEQVDSELSELRESSQRLRLVPAQTLFPVLERAVYDAAQSLGRRVEFKATGGEVRLDAFVLSTLRDALLHVVRNAVVHGLEDPAERASAGKAAQGTLSFDVVRRGNRAVFSCRDDGRGVDVEAVRRAVVERGFLPRAQAHSMSVGEVMRVLLTSGISTSASVTQLAGRGIGLDVVREAVLRLKGEVAIESARGEGSTFALDVPISVASLTALIVDVAGVTHAIPLDAVRSTLRVSSREIARSQDSESVVHEGKVVPFTPLARALRRGAAPTERRPVWPTVLVSAGGRAAALGVDRVLGTSNVVVRALPALVQADAVVAGAALDAEGNPQLVLDTVGLVLAAESQRGVSLQTEPRVRAPILVVDDSLTTRMLEQSILESAGYEVELAVSAEQALEKAALRRYGLFVVDVEMPGMDGFEFVAKTRADPVLQATPAVLVTSRNAPEDLKRGERVGARAYIVKGEFDQGHLLQVIRSLIG